MTPDAAVRPARLCLVLLLVALALVALALPASAHLCGPAEITLKVGETGAYRVTADITEEVSAYEPTLTGDILAADVSPAGFFEEHHGDFSIAAKAPGTLTLTVFWSYEPTGGSGVCTTTITVEDPASPPATPPSPPSFSPADGQVFQVYQLSSTLGMPVSGAFRDDDGDVARVTVNGVPMTWTAPVSSLSGGGSFTFRGTVPFESGGTDEAGRHRFFLDLRIEDEAGNTTESGHTTWLQTATTLSGSSVPTELVVTPTDGLPVRLESGQPQQLPVAGTLVDRDGDLASVTVNGLPMRFTHMDNSLSSGGQVRFRGHLPVLLGAGQSASLDLDVRAVDLYGGSVDARRTVFLTPAGSDAGHSDPEVAVFLPGPDTELSVPDTVRRASVRVRGSLHDPDENLVTATVNGHPVQLSRVATARYDFDGTVPLAPGDWEAPIVLEAEDADGHVITQTHHLRVRLDAATAVAGPLETDGRTPAQPTLAQNYPNPFNAGTAIEYALPEAGDVRLEVFNMAGQRVRQLADGPHAAGRHLLLWDGRDAGGRLVATGVYVFRLSTGDWQQSRRLLVLR